MEPVIAESARKHDVSDEDMLHAFRNSIRWFDVGEGMEMLVGADRATRLLEVGVVRADGGITVIVHAMPARPKFLRGM
ncbi:hypothetical protein [Actinoplanes sp. M2I2]|uniref:hypothetical protein n=1 Tax=Actinoplanes sp. M2I2 TaxID=1734444 RepID=UPI00202054AC|nr:hypothetical protein [Actinoplanes sp. M2I2]